MQTAQGACFRTRCARFAISDRGQGKVRSDADGAATTFGCGERRFGTGRNRHRSREFVSFLKKLDAAYPTDTAIKLILDNHSAHISKETKTWLAAQPEGRFTFVFTPKHGSWLNLVEGFFSKMARSVLRRIRVTSKDELKARILAYLDDLNREPVIHTWTYKLDAAA
jgi:transposase